MNSNLSKLSRDQIDRLLDLLYEYRDDVRGGKIVGFGQSQESELADTQELIDQLRSMQK